MDATSQVRAAAPGDLEALVALRQENGRVHAALDPRIYRVPDAEVVRRHFAQVLSEPQEGAAVLVLAEGDEVLGMVEVSLSEPPPEHQVLLPTPTARLHVVVAPRARGHGVGSALERAAADWAAARGVRTLVAGVQADNHPGRLFYEWAGYRDQSVVKVRDLP